MSYLEFYSSLFFVVKIVWRKTENLELHVMQNLKHEIEIIRYNIQIYVFSQQERDL